MRNWKGWWIIGFGFCMFMWGAFLMGHLNNHDPKPQLIVMVSLFTILSFFGSIQKDK